MGVGYLTTNEDELNEILEKEELVSESEDEEYEDGDLSDDEYGPRELSAKALRKRKQRLPPLPEGFSWYLNKTFYLAVPCPHGWTAQEEENTFAISTRKKGETARPGDTVMTVSCMPQQPAEFAKTFLHNFPQQLRQANKKVTSGWKSTKISETLEKHEMEFEDPGNSATPAILVKNLLVINKATGAVYLIMFECQKKLFNTVWEQCGEVMTSNIDFYKHF